MNIFKRFDNCNGIHAGNLIYTAKHCQVKDSKVLHYDISTLQTKTTSKLQIAKLNLHKRGSFKYYSMSKIGQFFNVLLQEEKLPIL